MASPDLCESGMHICLHLGGMGIKANRQDMFVSQEETISKAEVISAVLVFGF